MPSLFEAYGIEQETLAPPTPAKPPKADTLRKIADIGVSGAQGVVGGVKMLSDVFGADNAVSGALGAANEGLGNLLSPARMAELQNRQRLIKEAEESGTTLDQVKANIGGFFEAPVATVMQGLGSIAPSVAAMLIPGGQGVAGANLLRTATMLGLGAGQGAGAVKGSIYDGTKRELLEAGASPEEAEARATNAQTYTGPNAGQIGIGAGVGAVAGRFGAEGAVERIAKGVGTSPKAFLPRVGGGFVTEGGTEAFQGGQERYAVNQALNNEGFQVDPLKGVAGNAALEGLVGGAIGGGLNLPSPKQVEVSPGDAIRQNLQPETGALAKAVNAGIEAQAQQADATGVLPGAELVAEPDPIDDPFRDRITALPEGPKQEALRAYAVVNNPDAPKGVLNYNRGLLDRLLREDEAVRTAAAEAEAAAAPLAPPTETDVTDLLGPVNTDPLSGALEAVKTETAANQNLANWMQRATPYPIERAQELQALAKEQRGLDMAVVPHSSGSGFTVIPAQWVTPAMRNLVGGALPFDNAPTGAIRVDGQGTAAPETRPQQLATAAENQRRTDLGLPITARTTQGTADVSPAAPVAALDTGLAGPTTPEPAGSNGAGTPLAADRADGVLPVAGTPAPSSEPGVAVGTALTGNSLTNGEVDGPQADQAKQAKAKRTKVAAAGNGAAKAEPSPLPGAPGGDGVQAAGVSADGAPGSDAGNGFKQGPKKGERYRVGVVQSVGGAVAIEKRLPAGTAATFYVGKDGNLIDGDTVNVAVTSNRDRLWVPKNKEQADQASGILDEMGKLPLNDPKRADAKKRLQALVAADQAQQTETQRPEAPAAVGPLASITRAGGLPFKSRMALTRRMKQLGLKADDYAIAEEPDGFVANRKTPETPQNPAVGGTGSAPVATNTVANGEPLSNREAAAGQSGKQDAPDSLQPFAAASDKTVANQPTVSPGDQALQTTMGAAGWTGETGNNDTIWTKQVGNDRYTARFTPSTGSMEVTALVDAVDTQIASFKADNAEAAVAAANKAVADDAADSANAAPDVPAPVKTPQPGARAPIEDFGEKLTGARKDYAALLKDAEAVDVSAEPLSKSWPEPDYPKLLASGVDPFVVGWVRSSRDEVPTKPQKAWKLKGWVESVKLLRSVSGKLLDGSITKDALTAQLSEAAFRNVRDNVGGRAELYQVVGHEKSLKGLRLTSHSYTFYKGQEYPRPGKTLWHVEQAVKATAFGNWPREIVTTDTREQAVAAFKEKFAGLDLGSKAKAKASFVIYSKRGQPGAFIGKKIGREYVDLHKADDLKAARAYLESNTEALEKALARYKDTPYELSDDNAPRVGADHRGGALVTPQVFSDTFGFRGVQFGNYVEQGRRQSDLNEAYDALMDMAAVLELPPRALSLGGRLGLAFGARGKGGKNAPAAHYEPGLVVINLTKGGGPGSLAHEWFHAMDNYFAKEGGTSGFMTEKAKGDALRAEMRAAFMAIRRALQASGIKARSVELDKRRTTPYWSTPEEMAARTFESYVIAKLQDQSASNDYLANVVSQQSFEAADSLRLGANSEAAQPATYPYPTEQEMANLRTVYDEFFKTVQTKQDEAGNTVLFSREARNELGQFTGKADTIRQIVETVSARWKNPPGIVVINSMADAPSDVTAEYERQNSQGADGEAEGFYHRGKVYLVASALNTPADVTRVLFHETLGHAGLRGAFDGALEPILDQIATLRGDLLRPVAERYGLNLENRTDRLIAAEEVLAFLAQTKPEIGYVKRAIAAIRTWLRANIPGFAAMKLSDAEIVNNFILPARQFVERGNQRSERRLELEPAFGRREQLEVQLAPAIVGGSLGSASALPMYEAAKGGDVAAAAQVAKALVTPELTAKVRQAIGDQRPVVVPVASIEATGRNKIPLAAAEVLAKALGLKTADGLVQSNSPKRTALNGLDRIFAQPEFDGEVEPGQSYVLVDDTLTQGATFAALASHIQQNGGRVLASVALTGKTYSATLTPNPETLKRLREKYVDLEPQFQAATGFGFDGLTQSEARYLANFEPTQAVRDRIVEAGNQAGYGQNPADAGPVNEPGSPPVFSRTADPRDPNTFSQQTTDVFNDLMASTKTFNGWWHKSVGTQYHKAQKDREFKRVYDSAQSYIGDVSKLSNDAADLARDLLPRLNRLADVFKGGAKEADVKAIGKAIFQGTLGDKREYKPEELKRVFGLTDPQIALYQQFRAATNKSLDVLTASTIAKLLENGGFTKAQFQEAIDASDHRAMLRMVEDVAKRDPKAEPLAAQVREVSARADQLQGEGYAPLMRFGQYAVSARDAKDNSLQEFYLFETQFQANRKARELESTGKYKVDRSIMSQDDFKLLGGISPESLELFGDVLAKAGVMDPKDAVFEAFIRNAVAQRSAMKRMLERQGYPGYSTDLRRVLAAFITSNARLSSKNLHFSDMLGAAESISKSKGDVRDEATKLVNYVQNPEEEAGGLRSLLFVKYIGGSVASALVNLTQSLTMTLPYLSQFTSPLKASGILTSAMNQAATGVTDPDLKKAMAQAEQSGLVSPQEIHHLNAEAMQTLGSNPAIQKALFVWGSMFGAAEQYNRRVAFIAGWNTALAKGEKDPYAFAQKSVEETQGVYNKGNRPNWARGAVGATIFTFKQFSISYMEFLTRLPNREKALALAILMLAAGAEGLPFADDLDDVIDTIAQKMGYSFNSKQEKRRFLAGVLGQGGSEFALKGLSALPGMPIDVAGRMGMANLLPGTGVLREDVRDHMGDVFEFLGPAGGVVKDVISKNIIPGSALDVANNAIAPTAVRNLAHAIDMFQTGKYRDKDGRKVVDVEAADAAMKMIGFQPAQVARDSLQTRLEVQDTNLAKNVEQSIAREWALSQFEGDTAGVQAARERMREWNEKNPDQRIVINTAQIAQRLRQMRQSRADRIIKSTPKELRPGVQEALR